MFSTSNILDTLRLDSTGFYLIKLHAQRTFETYQALGIKIELDSVLTIYREIETSVLNAFSKPQLVRIIFNRNDLSYQFQSDDLGLPLKAPVLLQFMKNANQEPGVGLTNYKWEDRSFWTDLLKQKSAPTDDIISMNKNNYVTETSRFNIFIYSKKDDVVYTPSLDSGCINGVYRRFVFETETIDLPELGEKNVSEKSLTADDLKNSKIFVANSVRGILPASTMETCN